MGHAKTILVVDDDEEFRTVLREVLEGEGCSVYEAGDGRAALGVLRTLVPDLILFDLMMPVMNGWDLYAELQRDTALAGIPIACLSVVERMRPLGPMPTLHKPLNLPTLLELLQAIDAPERLSRAAPS